MGFSNPPHFRTQYTPRDIYVNHYDGRALPSPLSGNIEGFVSGRLKDLVESPWFHGCFSALSPDTSAIDVYMERDRIIVRQDHKQWVQTCNTGEHPEVARFLCDTLDTIESLLHPEGAGRPFFPSCPPAPARPLRSRAIPIDTPRTYRHQHRNCLRAIQALQDEVESLRQELSRTSEPSLPDEMFFPFSETPPPHSSANLPIILDRLIEEIVDLHQRVDQGEENSQALAQAIQELTSALISVRENPSADTLARLENLEAQLRTLQSPSRNLQDTLAQTVELLQQAQSTATARAVDLQTALSSASTTTSGLESRVAELEASLRQTTDLNRTLTAGVERLSTQLSTPNPELQRTMDEVNRRAREQQNTIAALQQQLNSLPPSATAAECEALRAKVSDLEAALSASTASHTELTRTIQQLQAEQPGAQSAVAELSTRVDSIQETLSALSADHVTQEMVNALAEQIATLQSTISQLTRTDSAQTEELDQLRSSLTSLQTQILALADKSGTELNEAIAVLQDRLSQSEAALRTRLDGTETDRKRSYNKLLKHINEVQQVLRLSQSEEAQKLREEIAAANAAHQALSEAIAQLEQNLNNTQTALSGLTEDRVTRAMFDTFALEVRNTQATLSSTIRALEETTPIQSEELAQLRSDLRAQQEQLATLHTQIASITSESLPREIASLRTQFSTQLQRLQDRLSHSEATAALNLRSILMAGAILVRKTAANTSRIESLEQGLTSLEARFDSLRCQWQTHLDTALQLLRTASQASSSLSQLVDTMGEILMRSQSILSQNQAELASLQAQYQQMQRQLTALQESQQMDTNLASRLAAHEGAQQRIIDQLNTLETAHSKLAAEMQHLSTVSDAEFNGLRANLEQSLLALEETFRRLLLEHTEDNDRDLNTLGIHINSQSDREIELQRQLARNHQVTLIQQLSDGESQARADIMVSAHATALAAREQLTRAQLVAEEKSQRDRISATLNAEHALKKRADEENEMHRRLLETESTERSSLPPSSPPRTTPSGPAPTNTSSGPSESEDDRVHMERDFSTLAARAKRVRFSEKEQDELYSLRDVIGTELNRPSTTIESDTTKRRRRTLSQWRTTALLQAQKETQHTVFFKENHFIQKVEALHTQNGLCKGHQTAQGTKIQNLKTAVATTAQNPILIAEFAKEHLNYTTLEPLLKIHLHEQVLSDLATTAYEKAKARCAENNQSASPQINAERYADYKDTAEKAARDMHASMERSRKLLATIYDLLNTILGGPPPHRPSAPSSLPPATPPRQKPTHGPTTLHSPLLDPV